jgi:hypothetical protein
MSIWKSIGDGATVCWGVVAGWYTPKFVAIKEGISVFLGWWGEKLAAGANGTMAGYGVAIDRCARKLVAIKAGIPGFLGWCKEKAAAAANGTNVGFSVTAG